MDRQGLPIGRALPFYAAIPCPPDSRCRKPDPMIISFSRRFIFIHIHKCAGESIESACAPALARNDVLIGAGSSDQQSWITDMFLERLTGFNKHSSAASVQERLGDFYSWFVKFAVVRRPDRRAYSLYTYCIDQACQSPGFQAYMGMDGAALQALPWLDLLRLFWARQGQTIATAATVLRPGGVGPEVAFLDGEEVFTYNAVRACLMTDSFEAFLQHPLTALDPGFAPQWQMLTGAGGQLLVDHVLKLESLAEDWQPLAARLGLPAELPRHNISRSAGLPPMTPAATAWLEQHFARDYDLFGYARA